MKTITKGEDWFHLFQKGDESAFKEVFDKYYRSITYYALKILHDDSYAEDISSEAFRKAWENRSKFETTKHLENFLYLVARNSCISYLRSDRVIESTQKEWTKLSADEEKEDSPVDLERVQARLLEMIYKKMEQLPGGDVLRMSFIEGKSTKQIAHELDMTDNNVYIIKSRSLKVLRTMLSKNEWMFFVLLFLNHKL
jgi:RNA polymerase sigma-70 factor (ECF subfamily)